MRIELQELTIKPLAEGYQDDGKGGVRGYGDKLDISRPINANSSIRTSSAML